jgi:hypothetical protein
MERTRFPNEDFQGHDTPSSLANAYDDARRVADFGMKHKTVGKAADVKQQEAFPRSFPEFSHSMSAMNKLYTSAQSTVV